ncbi:OLC1v1036060C1 [Oldenlandia corymbosa var. corymbosa]|uniref:OLC1v1036060C1 n=1 Tax=Oldenlandia corymbosa var. corymbosa TaxID=529605 RepID=A0AAV1CXN0_OLDCO|nr:OLC1v1036060C1 [Oldenlandia corymbosa var. corymbosa]
MGSKTEVKLPVIDFSEEAVNPGTNSWFSACKEIKDAFEDHTSFIIHYPTIKKEVNDAIFLASEELFDLPIERKLKNKSNPDKLFGYIGQIPQNPTFEGMVIEDATSQESLDKFTNLMWPSGNDRFCEIVESYTKEVSKLEKMVMRMIFESFGVKEFHVQYYESCSNFLALNKHRPPQLNEELGGVQEHTDPTFITLIQQNQISGLEVKSKDGSWISVDLPPSSFLVMAGDALLVYAFCGLFFAQVFFGLLNFGTK